MSAPAQDPSTTREGTDTWGNRGTDLVHRMPEGLREYLYAIGAVGQLTVQVFANLFTNPREYWPETRDEIWGMLRFCWIPVFVAVGGFCFLIGNYAYDLLTVAGAKNRLGTYFVFATAREISTFCTGMAVAAVMGTALCADLGARKVREELDALKVLGVDVVRTLVLPRVIAIVVMNVFFNIYGVLLGTSMAAISANALGDTSQGAYFSLLLGNMTPPEMIGSCVKMLLIGLFLGLVCASKGLNCGGGSEGVGRAVNEAVVLCFAAIWILNFVVNAVMLGLNPSMLINR